MNKNMQFNYLSHVVFGTGSLEKLHKQRFPGEKATIVISSKSSLRGYDLLSTVEEQLLIAGIEYVIYDCAGSIASDISVEKGAIIAQKNESYFLIGLGGTKAIDTAKAMSVFLFNSGYRQSKLPLWTIPTTASMGSEVNNTCIIWDTKFQKKVHWQNSFLYPDFCLIDPLLTQNIPPLITVQHGFSILFRAIDIFLSRGVGLQDRYFASIAIRTLINYLPRIINSCNDILMRAYISYSNLIVSFNNQYRFPLLEEVFHSTEREPEINYGDILLKLTHVGHLNPNNR